MLWSVLAAIALGVWGFAEIADEVMEGEVRAFDRAVLSALRTPGDSQDPVGPAWLEKIVRDFSALGGFGALTFLSLAGVGYLLLQGKWRATLLLAAAISGGGGLSLLLKMNFARPRPEMVARGAESFTSAFPSGHALMAAIVYLSLGAVLARLQPNLYLKAYFMLLAVLLTLLIGIARVYIGVHWPTDVLAGWLAGAVWTLLLWLVARWLQRRGKIEDVPVPEE